MRWLLDAVLGPEQQWVDWRRSRCFAVRFRSVQFRPLAPGVVREFVDGRPEGCEAWAPAPRSGLHRRSQPTVCRQRVGRVPNSVVYARGSVTGGPAPAAQRSTPGALESRVDVPKAENVLTWQECRAPSTDLGDTDITNPAATCRLRNVWTHPPPWAPNVFEPCVAGISAAPLGLAAPAPRSGSSTARSLPGPAPPVGC